MQRNTPKVLFATIKPAGFDKPELIAFNEALSEEIGPGKYEDEDLNFWLEITFRKTFEHTPQLMQDISSETGQDSLEMEEPSLLVKLPMRQEKDRNTMERSRCYSIFQTC